MSKKSAFDLQENLWEEDIWSFYDLSHAHEIPCETMGKFLLLINSPKVHTIGASGLDSTRGFVTLTLYGPFTDDINEALSKRGGCLRASYKLTKENVHDRIIGLSAEEKDQLVEIVRKKGWIEMRLFCNALNLRRVK